MARKKQHRDRMYQVVGEPGPGAIAAGYVRYSSDMQTDASIVTQKRIITEFATKKGWHIPESNWYEEPAQSAKHEDVERRPRFADLLRDAGTKYQVIICYSNSRWSRNVVATLRSLNVLRQKGVWWVTATEPWDIDKVLQQGFDSAFVISAQADANYVIQLSKRVIDGKEDRARSGYHNGSVMFGYLPPLYPKAPDGAPSTWRPPRMPIRIDPDTFPALVRIGELAAAGWSDSAIADELDAHHTHTVRFGERLLTKDTIASIRRSWLPREFAPNTGKGTVETPAGELVAGVHPSAWPYDLWQRIVEVKAGQYRRPTHEAQRRAHEFSRIVVCASCRRLLRVTTAHGIGYYKDASATRKLPCDAFGCLSVKGDLMVRQFGALLGSITLPPSWREAITKRCVDLLHHPETESVQERRTTLEIEQQRLVTAFAKGYLTESDLDARVSAIQTELLTLPMPITQDLSAFTKAAIVAGETLRDMAGYWAEAMAEERRDMVWALLTLNGLVYDLQRTAIVGIYPRHDVLPVLSLGLGEAWVPRDGGLWLHPDLLPSPRPLRGDPHKAYQFPKALTPEQEQTVLALLKAGHRAYRVAHDLNLSYWAIYRLMRREMPIQMQPGPRVLTPEQVLEAALLLQGGMSLRKVAQHFGVSHGAIWRLTLAKGGDD